MALKFKVESLEDVGEGFRDLYVEKDGVYILDAEGLPEPEDVSGLKSALDKERKAARDAERRAKRLEDERKTEQEKLLEDQQQYKSLWEKEKDEKQLLSKTLQDEKKRHKADAIVARLTNDEKQAKFLHSEILKNLEYVDGEVKLVETSGFASLDELQEHLKKEYPFLTGGSKASGAGALGNNRGTQTEDFSKLSPRERLNRAREAKNK